MESSCKFYELDIQAQKEAEEIESLIPEIFADEEMDSGGMDTPRDAPEKTDTKLPEVTDSVVIPGRPSPSGLPTVGIRNPFGSGTFVDFIWSTYENQKRLGVKAI